MFAVALSALSKLHAAAATTGASPRRRIVLFPDALDFAGGAKGVSAPARSAANEATVRRALDSLPANSKNEVNVSVLLSVVVSGFAAMMTEEATAHFASLGAFIEDDRVVLPTTHAYSWGIDRLNQPNLPLDNDLSQSQFGAGVDLFILDEGVRTDHDEFTGRVGDGFDAFGGPLEGYEDSCDHGTHCAGIALGNNYGVAKMATLHSVRVLECDVGGSTASVLAGLDWVARHTASVKIVSMSLGGSYSAAENAAVDNLVAQGVVVVAAAGNSAADACYGSPASATSAITVGSIDEFDQLSEFSNWGACVDIFAPGTDIVSASTPSVAATATYSGTSMAAPFVSGVAAQLASFVGARPEEVWRHVRALARRDTLDTFFLPGPNLLLQAACVSDNFVFPLDCSLAGGASGTIVSGGRREFSFIGTGAEVTFTTCGTSFDALLDLWAGCVSNADLIVSNDDDASCGGNQAKITSYLEYGKLYHISVRGFSASAFGYFELNVAVAGGCGFVECPSVAVQSQLSCAAGSTSATGSTVGAPDDGLSVAPSNRTVERSGDDFRRNSPERWHTVVGTGQSLSVGTCGSTFDTYVRMFKGCPSEGVEIALNDDHGNTLDASSCAPTASHIPALPLPKGEKFYVMVEGYGTGETGTYELALGGCDNIPYCPLDVSGVVACLLDGTYTTIDTTALTGDEQKGYKIKGTGTAITIDTCGSDFDTELILFRDCNSADEVAYNDDAPSGTCGSGSTLSSQLSVTVPVGEEWLLLVRPYAFSTGGNLKLRAVCPKPPTSVEPTTMSASSSGDGKSETTASSSSSQATVAAADSMRVNAAAIGGGVGGGLGCLLLICIAAACYRARLLRRRSAKIEAGSAQSSALPPPAGQSGATPA